MVLFLEGGEGVAEVGGFAVEEKEVLAVYLVVRGARERASDIHLIAGFSESCLLLVEGLEPFAELLE